MKIIFHQNWLKSLRFLYKQRNFFDGDPDQEVETDTYERLQTDSEFRKDQQSQARGALVVARQILREYTDCGTDNDKIHFWKKNSNYAEQLQNWGYTCFNR